MIEYIRKYDPDIIHLHNLHGYYVNIEILFKYLKSEYKGKVVWTLHDCWAYTGHCTHYTAVGCNKWKKDCKNVCRKRNTLQVSSRIIHTITMKEKRVYLHP